MDVTSKVLDTVFVSMYWPPDTYNEWNHALGSLMEEVNLIQAIGNFQHVFLGRRPKPKEKLPGMKTERWLPTKVWQAARITFQYV